MKFPEKGFIFKYLMDELADLLSGILLLPIVVVSKFLHPLLEVLK